MGIISESQFEALCHSYDQDVHPFKALEIVGAIDLDPPANLFGPVDGRLDFDRLRSAEHDAIRESLP